MKTRQIKIVDILSERKDWVTGKELSAILEVSDRTIRSDINAINCELKDAIEASVRYGYRLKEDASGVNQIQNDDLIPQSLEERCNFLIKRLFRYKKIGYISKMVNSRNRINEKIIFLHVSNTEEICDLMHSFLD